MLKSHWKVTSPLLPFLGSPQQPLGKNFKLYNLPVVYMHYLSLGKGEIFDSMGFRKRQGDYDESLENIEGYVKLDQKPLTESSISKRWNWNIYRTADSHVIQNSVMVKSLCL